MARPLRVDVAGGYHHVTTRGVGRQDIFGGDEDREFFLAKLGEAHERWGLVFHGYSLMSNHVHLEVETPRGELSRAMQWIMQTYATYFNRRHKRVGHLFQGRFKSALVEAETYFHHLTRYVHLNPVRAGLVNHPADYPWSSYRMYLGLAKSPRWLDTIPTLRLFGGQGRRQQVEKYREFVEAEMPQDPLRALMYGAVLGTQSFVEAVQRRLSGRKRDREVSGFSAARRRLRLCEIVALVEREYEVASESLWRKGRKGNEVRDVGIYLARQQGGISLSELGEACGGLGPSAVSLAHRRIAERIQSDEALRQKIKRLVEGLESLKAIE